MGYQAHANQVIQENKKLTSGYRSKRFTSYDKYAHKVFSKNKQPLLSIDTYEIDREKFRRELKTFFSILFVCASIALPLLLMLKRNAELQYEDYKKFNLPYSQSVVDGYASLNSCDLVSAERLEWHYEDPVDTSELGERTRGPYIKKISLIHTF